MVSSFGQKYQRNYFWISALSFFCSFLGASWKLFGLPGDLVCTIINKEACRKPQKASRRKPPGRYKKFQGRNSEIISLVILSKRLNQRDILKLGNWPLGLVGTEPILQDSVAFSPAKKIVKNISPGNFFENNEKSLHHSYLNYLIDLSPILVKEKKNESYFWHYFARQHGIFSSKKNIISIYYGRICLIWFINYILFLAWYSP